MSIAWALLWLARQACNQNRLHSICMAVYATENLSTATLNFESILFLCFTMIVITLICFIYWYILESLSSIGIRHIKLTEMRKNTLPHSPYVTVAWMEESETPLPQTRSLESPRFVLFINLGSCPDQIPACLVSSWCPSVQDPHNHCNQTWPRLPGPCLVCPPPHICSHIWNINTVNVGIYIYVCHSSPVRLSSVTCCCVKCIGAEKPDAPLCYL